MEVMVMKMETMLAVTKETQELLELNVFME